MCRVAFLDVHGGDVDEMWLSGKLGLGKKFRAATAWFYSQRCYGKCAYFVGVFCWLGRCWGLWGHKCAAWPPWVMKWQNGKYQGAPQHDLNHFSKLQGKCVNFWGISSYFGTLMGAFWGQRCVVLPALITLWYQIAYLHVTSSVFFHSDPKRLY